MSQTALSREEFDALLAERMSEAELLGRALATADRQGHLAYHVNVSGGRCPRCGHRRRADRRGFPDLWLPAPPVLYVLELKRQDGRATAEQARWLAELQGCERIDARLVRPADWPALERTLEGH